MKTELTPDQINVAIAELCGWKSRLVPPSDANPYHEFQHTWWTNPQGKEPVLLPSFATSLDAMAQAEATLTTNAEQDRYIIELIRATGSDAWRQLTATAAQRARAFLAVKQPA